MHNGMCRTLERQEWAELRRPTGLDYNHCF